MSGSESSEVLLERLLARVDELETALVERDRVIATQADQIAELQRRLGSDSSNSSRPPASDMPWEKKPAAKRSSRRRSGRKPGKQPGSGSVSRALIDDPNETVLCEPQCCAGCATGLASVAECARLRRQVVDAPPPPPAVVTEYQIITKECPRCGRRSTGGPDPDGAHGVVAEPAGSPVRIGPETLARCALLTCGHFLPVERATAVVEALTGMQVSTGWAARVRRRAGQALATSFVPHLRTLLGSAPVVHADETTGRAGGSLSYVHVACTEYLTLMHTGGRSADDIDAGGVLGSFTGTVVRDGYPGYEHLTTAVHAWCGAHLLRDLRAISDADPDGQLWASAMANTLLDAHHAARAAREHGALNLDAQKLAQLRTLYRGALARGHDDNQDTDGKLATDARCLLRRFTRYEDMILRFATDLTVPFTNNEAERAIRPVKVQQRVSGGCWRTLQGLADFALVQSYLDTATKWGIDKLDALRQLFTTGAWLPPALTPAE